MWQLAIVFFFIAVAAWYMVSRVVRGTSAVRSGRCTGCASGCSSTEPDLVSIKPLPKDMPS